MTLVDYFAQVVNKFVKEILTPFIYSPEIYISILNKYIDLNLPCNKLDMIRNIINPTVPGNKYIPYVLSRKSIHHNKKEKAIFIKTAELEPFVDFGPLSIDHRFRELFNGTTLNNIPPKRVYLHLYNQSCFNHLFKFMCDIDSVCGFASTLGFCCLGFK